MDLSQISDEEANALREALMARMQAPAAQEEAEPEAVQSEEDDAIQSIVAVLESQNAKIAAMDEEIDCLVKLVQEEIIDKVRDSVESNRRVDGVAGLSGKYGDKFGRYKDFYGKMTGGKDLFESLFDELEESRSGSPDWSAESEDGKIEEILAQLKERAEGMKGSLGESKEEAPEEGGKIEIEKVSAKPISENDEIVKQVKRMKKYGLPGSGSR